MGPLLGPGYLLLRDAVSTPRSYLTNAALGTGDAAPRAVPQDAAIALLSTVIDGGLIVKAIMFAALAVAGWGAAVLAREVLAARTAGQLLAVTVTIWNPFVAERLLQGHWSLLTGYAALLWTALAAYRVRTRAPLGSCWFVRYRGEILLALALATAAFTPTGGVLATIVALVLLPVRRWWVAGALALVANTPWLVPAFAGGGTSDPAGVAAFAARAEPALATLGSLAGLGGIWNSAAVPASRTGPFAALATTVLLAVVLAGTIGLWKFRRLAQPPARTIVTRLLVLAAVAVVVVALAATPLGLSIAEWLVGRVPGAGLLRDSQKYVALAIPGYALAAAQLPRLAPKAPAISAAAAVAALLVVLPDLAWGVGGQLRPVRYPQSWSEVASRIDGDGDVAVLPGGMFRKFPYSGRAPVLDPAPRMVPRDVLQTGALPVRGGVVRGESARAVLVESTLLRGGSPAELAQLGVGWILVEHTSAGPLADSQRTLAQLTPVYASSDLALYRIDGAAPVAAAGPPRWLAGMAHLLWAAMLIASAVLSVCAALAKRRADNMRESA